MPFFFKFDETVPNLGPPTTLLQELSTQPHSLHQLTESAQLSDGSVSAVAVGRL